VWFVVTAPKGTPAPIQKYLHDAAKTAMDDPGFVKMIADRGVDIDYRTGPALRQDLWREYRDHGEILKRLGMVKK
jgi:tripartite-type tricarboxylate transporter receptor subunit TctC